MAKFKHDDVSYHQAYMDTPFRGAKHDAAKTAEEAACMAGNAVKSIEREASGFPKFHGILVVYGDTCIVRSHHDGFSPKFVWEGTNQEYHQTWVVD